MTSRGRLLFLSLTVPLAAVTTVLLTKAIQYPALGTSTVLTILLLGLATAIRNRIKGEAPQRTAPLDAKNTGCLVLVFLFLALAVVLPADRPWNAPWWPGRHESTSLPDPCAVGLSAAATLVPAGTATAETDDDGAYGPTRDCTWQDPERTSSLRLSYQLVRWPGSLGGTATDTARDAFANDLTVGTPTALPGIGDEARRAVSASFQDLRARKANVLVEVTLISAHHDAARTAAVERLLRTAVNHIRVG
ncbi:hypothetical protein ABZ135_12955 [Streptomyces sp. NPDC006339]|uniref:hypothetical protein n=1 Tax=Streptomyces sp. NPDC006339 TaxID=3156755 RepID=UPI0033B055BC